MKPVAIAILDLGGISQGDTFTGVALQLCTCSPAIAPRFPPSSPPRPKFLFCSLFRPLFHRWPSYWNFTISFIYQQNFHFPLAISRPMVTKYVGVRDTLHPRDWGT
jgi:hypothetical protein